MALPPFILCLSPAVRRAYQRPRSTPKHFCLFFRGNSLMTSSLSRRGNSLLETAMFLPIILTLLVGMVQIGKITWVYYTLRKTLYTAARYVATQQGVNFCDEADAVVTAAKTFALTGTTDESAESLIPGLTPAQIQVRIERFIVRSEERRVGKECRL